MTKVTIELIDKAATALISILRRLEYTCALCGEFACYGFGISRVPTKVEAVIFASSGPRIEALRSQIIQRSKGHFFVSKDKPDTLLFYDHTMKGKAKNICVVDISYLDSPAVHLIRDVNGLPFVPLSYVILRKLEEWAAPPEKSTTRSRKLAAGVVQELLRAIYTMDDLETEALYPSLWDASRKHILRFMAQHSDCASAWEKLGFGSKPSVAQSLSSSQMQASEPSTIPCSPEISLEPEGSELPPIAEPTRTQMVIMAANDSVRLLSKCGWHSAIFGSLACFLYGNNRVPNDVDLLVLLQPGTTVTAEELKQNLVVLDPYHFFTTPSKNPRAADRILWYRSSDDPAQADKTSCKVDLVLSGAMNLPNLPPSLIHWDEGLPLVPFSLLLLQTLQAWDDHRRSRDPTKWQRQRTDMEDLDGLIGLSVFDSLKSLRPWSDTTLFSPEFQKVTRERVVDYCTSFPSSAPAWTALGFEI